MSSLSRGKFYKLTSYLLYLFSNKFIPNCPLNNVFVVRNICLGRSVFLVFWVQLYHQHRRFFCCVNINLRNYFVYMMIPLHSIMPSSVRMPSLLILVLPSFYRTFYSEPLGLRRSHALSRSAVISSGFSCYVEDAYMQTINRPMRRWNTKGQHGHRIGTHNEKSVQSDWLLINPYLSLLLFIYVCGSLVW